MPALLLVGLPGPRWLPPLPVPLILLWPLAWLCLVIAWIVSGGRPAETSKLYAAVTVFRELSGLAVDVESVDQRPVSIRFI